ncbi:tRNA pseudouridine(38-40) synthase TruA [Aneurinibacillus sp. Ricciae_BoGa-3]|uniref:tRNA pseudouridine(38-40) synthase TruA n=1 Tax=Aneurinibacillus sp. Ricciae_BoGa-3 TaxID=3022697 RepID=UPI00233FBD9A|nr:tRNA pseudouridine(38-40) synthase TruA [Aneurinibacillus sp. Ricciae_BoGa-3]WCK54792.1 tRNA pseudouridine(38-40) synthase TruA [Aneurinibacillus sp. Ricciae_BoGa-3]
MQWRKIKLTFSYQGTAYYGLQRQKNGPSIQEEIEKVLARILGHEAVLVASGRTDSGVHARMQVAHFCTSHSIPADRLPLAINTFLPDDIVILEALDVPQSFHARYHVIEKTYRYRVLNQRVADPFLRDWACHVRSPLDLEKMRMAASYLTGTHDFTSFSSIRTRTGDRVRTVYEIRIEETLRDTALPAQGRDIWLAYRGSGFLYNMVRMMTGALLEVGKGRMQVDNVKRMLDAKDALIKKVNAPAHGLYLWDIQYAEPDDIRIKEKEKRRL